MAWISKPRQRKDGSLYWSVYFREPNPETGKKHQTSLSYDDYDDADRACQLIDQVGPEKARDILRIVASPRHAQTVAQFLSSHIDHLTGVEAGTIARYRTYLRNDIAPMFLIGEG